MSSDRMVLGKAKVCAALALLVAALTIAAGSADAAVSQSCIGFRRSIINLETTSIRPPQWLSLDLYLRQLYERDCIDEPGYQYPAQYWYRSDGSPTGVPASGSERPADGAYTTTEEHGADCAGSGNPGICALALDVQDAEGKVAFDPADALPPLGVTLAGHSFAVGAACVQALQVLAALNGGDAASRSKLRGQLRAALAIQSLRDQCPDLLDALARRIGAADEDTAAFRDGIRNLIGTGFDVVVAGKGTNGAKAASFDQGFQRMCQQAERFSNQCRIDQHNMGQVGTASHSTAGQAGAFNDCANLYDRVVAMCRASAYSPAPREAKQTPAMSAQCRTIAGDYAAAAKAQDSSRSLAAYESLKQSCPAVLEDVARRSGMALPEAAPFPQRAMGGLTQDVMGGCVAAADSCNAAADAAAAGTSGAARAALFNDAVGFGLALDNLMVQGVALGQGQAASLPNYRGSDMSSLNRRVRSTYGQGSATGKAPPASNNSTITGTP